MYWRRLGCIDAGETPAHRSQGIRFALARALAARTWIQGGEAVVFLDGSVARWPGVTR